MSSIEKLDKALIEVFTASGTILKGQAFTQSGTGATAVTAATGASTHIALDAATVGQQLRGVHIGSTGIVMALVGTGGATENLQAAPTTNGATDVTLASVAGAVRPIGVWKETGVAGDLRPLYLGLATPYRAT